jgi:hypothetical protein
VGSIPTGSTKKLVDWNLPPLGEGLRICSEKGLPWREVDN